MEKICCFILAIGVYLTGWSQPGALDLSFNPGTGTDKEISATAIQQDGKILIGGRFTAYNGHVATKIARLHPDGTLDTAFQDLGLSGRVRAIAIQPDEKVIIAGQFTLYDTVSVRRIMRLNTDGSHDTTFNPGTGFNDYVFTLALLSDGKILAGGNFTTFNGISSPRIARLNPDGSIDSTFVVGAGFDHTVEDIVIQPFDNKIIVCGDFTAYQGSYAGRMIRLNTNGSRDGDFTLNFGASSVAYATALQDNGKIVLAGSFHNYNNIQTGRIARLHPDGDRDSNFDPGFGADTDIRDIEIITVGGAVRYLLIGDFTSFDLTPINRIALVDTFGNPDHSFDPGSGADSILQAMSRQQDGRIIIAGDMTTYDGVPRKGIARIYSCATPQPGTISGVDTMMCAGEAFTFSVPQAIEAKRYEWMLTHGWAGASDSSSITVISNGQEGVISVRAFSDSCGYSVPQTKTIYRAPVPEDPICLVTVNDSSTHNILIWEKTSTNLIDSFFIYRETTTNVYTKIASLPYDSLSEYHDYDANPNATSYRYKLSALDTCGVETPLSLFHNTIHLQNLGSGNFQWTFYEIENTLNPVLSFNVYRDSQGNGNFIPIGLVPGSNTTFTDVNWFAFPDARYVVDVNWGRPSCTPSRTVNTTRSNIRKIGVIDTVWTGMEQPAESIEIYPNPAEEVITLRLAPSVKMVMNLRLTDQLGRPVWSETTSTVPVTTIPVGMLPGGVYFLSAETNEKIIRKKVIIR